MKKKILTSIIVIAVFLIQIWRNSGPNAEPNAEPYVVIIAGGFSAFLAWAFLQLVFLLLDRHKK